MIVLLHREGQTVQLLDSYYGGNNIFRNVGINSSTDTSQNFRRLESSHDKTDANYYRK
jgi:hypothetical protein